MEFSCQGHTNDFFPINVSFYSKRPYAEILVTYFSFFIFYLEFFKLSYLRKFLFPYFLIFLQVNDVVLVDDGTSVKYAADSNFFTEKYEILWRRYCFGIVWKWQSVRDFASYPSPSR